MENFNPISFCTIFVYNLLAIFYLPSMAILRNLILVLLLGCGVRVIQYVNDRAPFAQYEDYVLVGLKGKNVGSDPSNLLIRIEGQIHEEMQRRDYKVSDTPDLILRYEVVASTKTETRNSNYLYGPIFMPNSRTITESVILLEMTDAKTKKLVWQASLDLREHNKITKKKDVLKSALINIFNTYLYRAGNGQPDQNLVIND